MPNNRPSLRSRILTVALLTVSLALGSVPLQNPKVRAIGELITCQCGCKYSVSSCNMQQCHFADPAREKLLKMVESGMSEADILAAFEREYGKQVLRKPPTEGFYLLSWIMPYITLGAGLAFVGWFIQRYFRRRPAADGGPSAAIEADSPDLAKYRGQIEKDLADLDK